MMTALILVSKPIRAKGMPMPNCTQDISSVRLEFGYLGQRVIEGRFDGGNMTSDGDVMLLAALDQRLGLTDAAERSIADPREPRWSSGYGHWRSKSRPWRMRRSMPCEINYSSSRQSSTEIRASSGSTLRAIGRVHRFSRLHCTR